MKRGYIKRGIIVIAILLVVMAVAFVAWTRVARYPAFPEATAVAQTARTPQGWYVFPPTQPSDTGLIFYPGGLVDPAAYAPLMKSLAEQGIMSVIVPMPLDLAIFGANKANDVIAAHPEIKHWIIGGHSLGGSMAAQYVKDNPTNVQGMVFWAAYPADNVDLSKLPVKFVSIRGSHDGLATAAKVQNSLKNLPPDTKMILIEGGNHAQYGNYGPQAGDGRAMISRDEQQLQTANATLELANQLHR